jgi:hypothetical protein
MNTRKLILGNYLRVNIVDVVEGHFVVLLALGLSMVVMVIVVVVTVSTVSVLAISTSTLALHDRSIRSIALRDKTVDLLRANERGCRKDEGNDCRNGLHSGTPTDQTNVLISCTRGL